MLLTALFSDGDTEDLMCLVMDKQKVRGKKAEPPVLLVTQLFSNWVKEATLLQHTQSSGYVESTQEKETPMEPCSQMRINCIL